VKHTDLVAGLLRPSKGQDRNGGSVIRDTQGKSGCESRSNGTTGDGTMSRPPGTGATFSRITSARQVLLGSLRTASAARCDPQVELEVGQRGRTGSDAGAHLTLGNGIANTNVHANNYYQ